MSRKFLFFILVAALGTFWAWFVNDQNVKFVQQSGGGEYQGMIETADDASYIQTGINYSKKGIWKDNSEGLSSYIQRPPGMGFINFCLHRLFKENFYGAHKWVALAFHFLALILFGLTVHKILPFSISMILQCMYAVLPCFWGFLFYHLAESITSSLLVFLFYGYVGYYKHPKAGWLIFQSLMVSVLLLVRPQLAVFTLPFIYFLMVPVKKISVFSVAIISVCIPLAFGGFAVWQIRNMVITKKISNEGWNGIHPIYSTYNTSQYRPVHRSFCNLVRVWEHNSAEFHRIATTVYEDGTSMNDIDSGKVQTLVDGINTRGCKGIDRDILVDVCYRYELVLREKRYEYLSHRPLNGETPSEEKLRKDMDVLTAKLRRQNVFLCYVKTPLRSAFFLFSKSQLNLRIFQLKYRGYWWMEGLRYFCIVLISVLSLLTLACLLTPKERLGFLIAISFVLYLFYLFFIQKMNEERYLMPLLPVLLISGTRFAYKRIYEKNYTS